MHPTAIPNKPLMLITKAHLSFKIPRQRLKNWSLDLNSKNVTEPTKSELKAQNGIAYAWSAQNTRDEQLENFLN